jgi:hypothetical protein
MRTVKPRICRRSVEKPHVADEECGGEEESKITEHALNASLDRQRPEGIQAQRLENDE